MPYAEPTSPVPSPMKTYPPGRRRPSQTKETLFRSASAPMQGIPRRSSTSSATSPPVPQAALSPPRSVDSTLEAMRSVNSIPRQAFPDQGSLGLSLSGEASRICPSPDSNSVPTTPEDNSGIMTFSPLSYTAKTSPSHSAHTRPKATLTQHRPKFGRERGNSATALDAPNDLATVTSSYTRPTAMIRKKSGEIVKPSLKVRSLSTPDLGRADVTAPSSSRTSKSTRDLQEASKSVRFNDGGLESVVLFLREQKVTAVSKTADGEAPATETEDDNDDSDYVHFRTRRGGRGSPDDTEEIQIDQSSVVPRVRTDFGPGADGLLDDHFVMLERTEMQNGTPLLLRGSVIARNIAFEKFIAVRFTLDHWQTTSEVSGQHVCHIPKGTTGDEGWDRFSFSIKLDDVKRKISDRSLHLCVRYNSNGGEWWDSNNGENYRFSFKRVPRPRGNLFRGGVGDTTSFFPPFNVPRSVSDSLVTPRNARPWLFPRSAMAEPKRAASPMLSPPPAASYKAPPAPNVHSHLKLKGYCAPSPPQSPPKPVARPMTLAPVRGSSKPPMQTLVHGRPASNWVPTHERSSSWGGQEAVPWAEPGSEPASATESRSGDVTPTAQRSPEPSTPDLVHSSSSSKAEGSPTKAKIQAPKPPPLNLRANRRSTGDLQSLADATNEGIITPPSSNLSSPPTPTAAFPDPPSPSATLSTGESTPLNEFMSESPVELSLNDGDVDFERGRTLNAQSYQEFLDKFCFFKSTPTVAAELEDPFTTGSGFMSLSSYNAPFAAFGSGSPCGTLTPTEHSKFDTPEAMYPSGATSTSGSTPRANSPAFSNWNGPERALTPSLRA